MIMIFSSKLCFIIRMMIIIMMKRFVDSYIGMECFLGKSYKTTDTDIYFMYTNALYLVINVHLHVYVVLASSRLLY